MVVVPDADIALLLSECAGPYVEQAAEDVGRRRRLLFAGVGVSSPRREDQSRKIWGGKLHPHAQSFWMVNASRSETLALRRQRSDVRIVSGAPMFTMR